MRALDPKEVGHLLSAGHSSRSMMPACSNGHRMNHIQYRILRILSIIGTQGALSRRQLAERLGCSQVFIGYAVGYSNPQHRAQFEQSYNGWGEPGKPYPSLLTLGYIEELDIDIDGGKETVIKVTKLGVDEYNAIGDINLPPIASRKKGTKNVYYNDES